MGSVHTGYPSPSPVNFGYVVGVTGEYGEPQDAYVMGVKHAVREFDGRVIAVIHRKNNTQSRLVVAPKARRYIVNDIKSTVDFLEKNVPHCIECLYERSCGAVVFCKNGGENLFLLIKNKRSSNWGFPKGHMEAGETERDTAVREVREETGLDINILPGFAGESEYTIQGHVEKSVKIFLGKAENTKITMQPEEIEDCRWADFSTAVRMIRFENDKALLRRAAKYIERARR